MADTDFNLMGDPTIDDIRKLRAQPIPGITHGSIPGIGGIDAPGLMNLPSQASNRPWEDWRKFGSPEFVGPPKNTGPSKDTNSSKDIGTVPSGGEHAEPTFAARAISSIDKEAGDQGNVPLPRSDPRKMPAESASTEGLYNQARAPAPGAQPSMANGIQEGSLLHRIFSGNIHPPNSLAFTLLALGAGMAGAPSLGTGLGRGLTNAIPAMRMDIAQDNQNATVNALMSRMPGISINDARAIASNPTLMQQIAGQAFGAKQRQWTTIGHDILGNPQYGFVDPVFGTVTDMSGRSVTGTQGTSGSTQGIDQNRPIYDQIPKAQQGVVDSMLAGRMPMPSAMAMKTPYWNTMIAAADERSRAQGGPGFDATTWGQRNQTAKDFATGGKAGQAITAFETVAGHIGKLSDASEKLDNSGWTAWNRIRNGIANTTPLDQERTRSLQEVADARKAVVDEMGNAYKNGHLTDSEVRDWSALFNNVDSKVKMRQALSDFTHLLESKRDALVKQHRAIMGSDPPGLGQSVFPAMLKKTGERNADTVQQQPQSQQAPQTQLPRITTKADYDKLAPGASFFGEDGKQYMKPGQ